MSDAEFNRKDKRPRKKRSGQIADREPPFNLEAEVGVLGSLMLMPDASDDIVSILRPEDFYDEAHAKIFAHMMDMHGAGKKIDMLLLRERLMGAGDYDAVGGAAGLAEIFTSVPNAAHVHYYAEIVRGKATARNVIVTCSTCSAMHICPRPTHRSCSIRLSKKSSHSVKAGNPTI